MQGLATADLLRAGTLQSRHDHDSGKLASPAIPVMLVGDEHVDVTPSGDASQGCSCAISLGGLGQLLPP